MEVTGKLEETTDSGHLSGHVHCELCQGEKVGTKATGACRECEEYMCDTCFKHHLKAKACRSHVVISVSELPTIKAKRKEEDVENCKKHNEVIKFYCRTHAMVGCGDCIILEHTNCKPEYIRDLAKSFRNDDTFKQLFKKIDQFESMKTEGKKKMKNNRKKIDLLTERALDEMKKFRAEINAYFDKAEADIVSEVAKVTSENEKLHNEMGQDMEALTADIEEMQTRFSDNQHSETVKFINAVTYKPTIETIEQRYKQLQPEKVLKQFEFVRSENIAAILKSAPRIGMVRIDSDVIKKETEMKDVKKKEDSDVTKKKTEREDVKKKEDSDVTKKETERKDVKNKEDWKTSDFPVGTRVRRGPDWRDGDEDGGGPGTVTRLDGDGWTRVKWDSGRIIGYRIGHQNAFELSVIYD